MSTFKPKDKSASQKEKKQTEEKSDAENRARAAVDELLKQSYQMETNFNKNTAESSNKEQSTNIKTENITAPIAVLENQSSTDDTSSSSGDSSLRFKEKRINITGYPPEIVAQAEEDRELEKLKMLYMDERYKIKHSFHRFLADQQDPMATKTSDNSDNSTSDQTADISKEEMFDEYINIVANEIENYFIITSDNIVRNHGPPYSHNENFISMAARNFGIQYLINLFETSVWMNYKIILLLSVAETPRSFMHEVKKTSIGFNFLPRRPSTWFGLVQSSCVTWDPSVDRMYVRNFSYGIFDVVATFYVVFIDTPKEPIKTQK